MTDLPGALFPSWLSQVPLAGLGLLLDGLVDRLEGGPDAIDRREREAAAAAAAESPVGLGLHQRGAAGDRAQAEDALAYRHPAQRRHPPQLRPGLDGAHLDLAGHVPAARR